MVGLASRRAAVSAMAAAYDRRPLFTGSKRSRTVAVCAVCRSQHHGCDAGKDPPRGRHNVAALLGRGATMAGARRRALRPHSVVGRRFGNELECRAGFDAAARALSRYRQSRLFHHQASAADFGVADLDRGRDRPISAGPNAASVMIMPWLGLSLLVLVGFGVVFTGVPAAVILLATACFGAAIGALGGDVPIQLLGALPERLINLLDNDLLQAIPLYVLMGALINRLPLADALYRCGLAIVPGPAAPVVSGLTLGALLGPMNGSVGASVLALARVAEPRLAA